MRLLSSLQKGEEIRAEFSTKEKIGKAFSWKINDFHENAILLLHFYLFRVHWSVIKS